MPIRSVSRERKRSEVKSLDLNCWGDCRLHFEVQIGPDYGPGSEYQDAYRVRLLIPGPHGSRGIVGAFCCNDWNTLYRFLKTYGADLTAEARRQLDGGRMPEVEDLAAQLIEESGKDILFFGNGVELDREPEDVAVVVDHTEPNEHRPPSPISLPIFEKLPPWMVDSIRKRAESGISEIIPVGISTVWERKRTGNWTMSANIYNRMVRKADVWGYPVKVVFLDASGYPMYETEPETIKHHAREKHGADGLYYEIPVYQLVQMGLVVECSSEILDKWARYATTK